MDSLTDNGEEDILSAAGPYMFSWLLLLLAERDGDEDLREIHYKKVSFYEEKYPRMSLSLPRTEARAVFAKATEG